MISHIILGCDDTGFELDTYFIGLYYGRELRKLPFIKFRRINIDLLPNQENSGVLGEKEKVCYVLLKYDIKYYYQLNNELEKSIEITNLFHRGLMLLCDKMNWDKTAFIQIREKLFEDNFKVEWPLKKKSNATKDKVYGYLSFSIEMKRNKCYVHFERGNTVFCSLLIFEGMPGFIYWKFLFKNQYWENKEVFVVADYQKEILFKCNYMNGTVDVIFDSTKKTQQQLESKLKTWEATTDSVERDILFTKYWTPITKEYFD